MLGLPFGLYVLDGKNAVPCDDVISWARQFEVADRRVAFDAIYGLHVSTVFIGLDHNYFGGEPLLFETMVFPNYLGVQERYTTWEEAEAGHARIVAIIKKNPIKWVVWPMITGFFNRLARKVEYGIAVCLDYLRPSKRLP